MQALAGEKQVFLYQLDLTPLGVTENAVLCFTKDTREQDGARQRVSFLGVEYEPIDIDANGFDFSGTGAYPQPTLRVTNINMQATLATPQGERSFSVPLLSGLLREHGDLVGARITRIRTFERFLAGGPDASLAASSYQWDMYYVDQKLTHNKLYVEFRLSSAIDQQGRSIPVRKVLRDICPWRYRSWDKKLGRFDNASLSDPRARLVTCPYIGTSYFDIYGNSTSAENDRCSKHVDTGCRRRYPRPAAMPFGGFPGVARTR